VAACPNPDGSARDGARRGEERAAGAREGARVRALGRAERSSSSSGAEPKSDEEGVLIVCYNHRLNEVFEKKLLIFTNMINKINKKFNSIVSARGNSKLEDDSAESNEATGVFGSNETGLGRSRTKASAKVVLPAKSTNSFDHKDSTGLSSLKGALLGLASYDSDDDDDADTDSKDKMPISNLSSKDNAGDINTEGDKSTLGKRNGNHNEQNSSLGSAPSGEDLKSNNQNFQRSANAEPEQMHIRDTENGEFRFKAKTCTEPMGAFDRMDEKANTYAEVYIQNRKNLFCRHRHSEKSSTEDFVNEVKADHTKELEYSRAEKYNNDDKYSMYGNIDKRGSCKEGKGSGRAAKHESDTREPHYRGNSKLDGAKAHSTSTNINREHDHSKSSP
ncbi:hypothetical protein ACJX0J_029376, partial [Zea mays]